MSTLTWITGKELKREIKQRKPISLEEKHENNIAVVRVCCTCKVVFFLLIRNKSVLHVQSFFLPIRKKVCCTCKVVFLPIRSNVVVFYLYRCRCFHPVFSVTRFYIFIEETINIKESFAFSPGKIYTLRVNHSAHEKKNEKKKDQSILFLFIFSSKASKFSFPYKAII